MTTTENTTKSTESTGAIRFTSDGRIVTEGTSTEDAARDMRELVERARRHMGFCASMRDELRKEADDIEEGRNPDTEMLAVPAEPEELMQLDTYTGAKSEAKYAKEAWRMGFVSLLDAIDLLDKAACCFEAAEHDADFAANAMERLLD